MNKMSCLPQELQFLNEISGDRNQQYRSASWLKSPFEDNIWQCDFGEVSRFTLDFRVELEDGTLLTDPRHNELLVTFKCWICAVTHFDATGGVLLADVTAYEITIRVLKLIDYFLLNAARFRLAKYGLSIITEGDLKMLVSDLASASETNESIYRWSEKATQYLKTNSSLLSLTEQGEILKSQPLLAITNVDPADRILKLNDEELTRARIYLWKENMYHHKCKYNYQFLPKTKALSSVIYRNTLWGDKSKAVPRELCVGPMEHYYNEYPAVPVTTNGENRLSERQMNCYLSDLRNLGLLEEIGVPVPLKAINALQRGLLDALNLKSTGRFRTLPQSVVFPALKHAIEFVLEYGDDLIDSYLNLVRLSNAMGVSFLTYITQYELRNAIKPKIRNIGASTWSLNSLMSMKECNIGSINSTPRQSSKEYFRRFRSNEGLYELLCVLYGCIQICVGMLTARRQAELIDLIAGKCLDRTSKYLVFYNRKSGIMGKREKEARPIPPVAVRMIHMLERLQTGLIEQGHLKQRSNLFARPDLTGVNITAVSVDSYNTALNTFCDYFETPLNTMNQRYYIRQHQLRRFFAMLFFWGRSFGGMETLRWFLGHANIEHLYHYITECTTGEVLQSVKAVYAAEQVREQSTGSEALAELLQEHYGTRQFSVLDAEELAEYIEYLMNEKRVQIEPEFFTTPQGQNYKVLIKVKEISK